ncbi:hypothetical protein PSCLAVI8L_80009 [Pseudoclavibacter sp. 8L]|nr:hypothetical protein PSCLAVI8L_80009 [Pseudoclavibacter sp. 8L]
MIARPTSDFPQLAYHWRSDFQLLQLSSRSRYAEEEGPADDQTVGLLARRDHRHRLRRLLHPRPDRG